MRLASHEPHVMVHVSAATSGALMERLTWPEIGAAIENGHTTVVIACGAVEQHGPHLPLFMDAENGTRLAEEVARRLGNALVAPTIRVGCSEHHMSFAGTISLRTETFEAVCQDYCTSLARHGFQNLFFVPSHGGNFAPLARMLPQLNELVRPRARVVAFTELQTLVDLWKEIVQDEVGLGDRVGGHADIAEASIMLALHPELVHEDRAVPGFAGGLTPDVVEQLFREGMAAITANGILGDPRGMTVAIGRRCIAETADMLVDYFHSVTELSR